MAYFKYRGENVRYNEVDVSSPLLLLYGNAASSRISDEVVGLYARDFRVILIDFLGHGITVFLVTNKKITRLETITISITKLKQGPKI